VKIADQLAWSRLVNLFSPLVYRWLRSWGISEIDAADLVQNVFLQVFKAIARFDRDCPGSSFRGWLWRITRNEATNFFRGPRLRQTGSDVINTIPDRQDDDELRCDTQDLLRRIMDLISQDFEPRTCEIFKRLVFDGRDTNEVAREFGMKNSAVREAKRRVAARLRDEFSELMRK
jgi:RNA polymerase sigma-70 factor (ECF subfamily)